MAVGSRGADASARGALVRGAAAFRIDVSAEDLSVFQTYIDTLLFWRTRLSLTGASSELAIVHDHILDSLSIARFIQAGWRVADLGSGAGFPGVPLAIVRRQCSVFLMESRRKRANFLRDVARKCRLRNLQVIESRAESPPAAVLQTFDLVVSRAVWTVPAFLTIASPLSRPTGLAVAMKGPKGLAEAVEHPDFRGPEVVRYELDGGVERLLVVYFRRNRG